MNKEKILTLVKILESNTKLLQSYKKINKKIEDLEENISKKYKDKEEENRFIQQIIETSNDNYYRISKNCLD
jgi:hypothetical protein